MHLVNVIFLIPYVSNISHIILQPSSFQSAPKHAGSRPPAGGGARVFLDTIVGVDGDSVSAILLNRGDQLCGFWMVFLEAFGPACPLLLESLSRRRGFGLGKFWRSSRSPMTWFCHANS